MAQAAPGIRQSFKATYFSWPKEKQHLEFVTDFQGTKNGVKSIK